MGESASATIAATHLPSGDYQYTITLDDTGSTPIGTFWFGWVPCADFLATMPSSMMAPAGWTAMSTHWAPATDLPLNGLRPPRPRILRPGVL